MENAKLKGRDFCKFPRKYEIQQILYYYKIMVYTIAKRILQFLCETHLKLNVNMSNRTAIVTTDGD